MPEKKSVLFLCVHNSARSILAEFLTKHYLGGRIEAASAGLSVTGVNPFGLQVLQELGIDTTAARSKDVSGFRGSHFDLVVTVCAPSEGECPVWMQTDRQLHVAFNDPAKTLGSVGEILDSFRAVRDEMVARLIPLVEKEMA